MINIYLVNPTAANQGNDETPCFRVLKQQSVETLTQFFESLGFFLKVNINNDAPFLDVVNDEEEVVAKILVSGSHLEVAK